MPAIQIAKSPKGVSALGSNGEVQEISNDEVLSEIERLVRARQAAGVKLTQLLKQHGFDAMDDDEETETLT